MVQQLENDHDPFPSESPRMMKCSIWMVPPEPILSQLQAYIDDLAKIQNTPTFKPHITLIGGIYISKEKISVFLQELQLLFNNFGEIPCQVIQHKGIVGFPDSWNQSCVSLIHRSKELLQAITLVYKFIQNHNSYFSSHPKDYYYIRPNRNNNYNINKKEDQEQYPTKDDNDDDDDYYSFPSPLLEPHISWAYGNNPSLIDSIPWIPPPHFLCRDLIVMLTHPSTLDGVSKWVELGRISLMP